MINKILIFAGLISFVALSFVLYNNANSAAIDFDVSAIEKKMEALKEDLEKISKEYAALKSSIPVPVETQLDVVKDKLSELDSIVTDQSDILKRVDPNGILTDTENWISESYENAVNLEQNGWSRVNSAEILERYNRLDQAAYESVADVYLNADNGRMKAYALGVIKEHVTEDMKEPMLENLKELTKDGEFKNGWHVYNLAEALGNFASDPEVAEQMMYLAENHPNDNIARLAAEKLGATIEKN